MELQLPMFIEIEENGHIRVSHELQQRAFGLVSKGDPCGFQSGVEQ